MENPAKERLTGAVILVALIVLVVPELLSGPRGSSPHPSDAAGEAPMRSYTVQLNDESSNAAAAQSGRTALPPESAPQPVSAEQPEPGAQPGTQPGTQPGAQPGAQPGTTVQPRAAAHQRAAAAMGQVDPAALTEPAPQTEAAAQTEPAARTEATPQAQTGSAARAAVATSQKRVHATVAASEVRGHAAGASAVAMSAAAAASRPARWQVQVGSFGSRAHADLLAHRLKSKGFGAFVTQSVSHGRKWYRVRVGPERDRAAALAMARRLHAAGETAVVQRP